MYCRVCGHHNKRETGKCANCGFDLGVQNTPLADQRKSLEKRSTKPVGFEERMPMKVHKSSSAGLLGAAFVVIGLFITVFIVTNYERAVLVSESHHSFSAEEEIELPIDSITVIVGSDIVYVMNKEGTSAVPRTNLNLQLIPEGSTAAVLCHKSVPLKPLVVFVERKLIEFKGVVIMDQLCVWNDSTEEEFRSINLVSPPHESDSLAEPVVMKLILMDEWLVGRIEEFNIDIPSPLTVGFTQSKFDSVMNQVTRRLSSRDLGEREIHVWAMFPEESTVGDIMDILFNITPSFDSLGFKTYRLKYFRQE